MPVRSLVLDALVLGADRLGWLLAQSGANAGDDASSQLSMVIVGLLVLALVITIATAVFWRLTRPSAGSDRPAMSWRTSEPDGGAEQGRGSR